MFTIDECIGKLWKFKHLWCVWLILGSFLIMIFRLTIDIFVKITWLVKEILKFLLLLNVLVNCQNLKIHWMSQVLMVFVTYVQKFKILQKLFYSLLYLHCWTFQSFLTFNNEISNFHENFTDKFWNSSHTEAISQSSQSSSIFKVQTWKIQRKLKKNMWTNVSDHKFRHHFNSKQAWKKYS